MRVRISRLASKVFLGAALLSPILLFGCQGAGDLEGEGAANLDAPGVRQTGPNHYDAVIIAFEGGFGPNEIRVPVGAEVRFRVRSADVPHGLLIEGTDVALEAQGFEFAEATHTFTEAGEYSFICHIYCIGGHDMMTGTVIVE